MPIVNHDAINMAVPAYKNDQIIRVFQGSGTVGAPTAIQGNLSVTNPHAHELGDSAYFRGRFTTDGGTTWNDFGAQTPFFGSVTALQTADCNAIVDGTNANVTMTSWYDFGNSRSQSYNFQYQLFLMAKNHMATPFKPLTTNEIISWRSSDNYQKIIKADTAVMSVASGNTGSVPVAHNLGKIPTVRAWWFAASSPTICRPLPFTVQVRIDTANVTFFADQTAFAAPNLNGNLEYRIYYD
jgi:hypothetical protein